MSTEMKCDVCGTILIEKKRFDSFFFSDLVIPEPFAAHDFCRPCFLYITQEAWKAFRYLKAHGRPNDREMLAEDVPIKPRKLPNWIFWRK